MGSWRVGGCKVIRRRILSCCPLGGRSIACLSQARINYTEEVIMDKDELLKWLYAFFMAWHGQQKEGLLDQLGKEAYESIIDILSK